MSGAGGNDAPAGDIRQLTLCSHLGVLYRMEWPNFKWRIVFLGIVPLGQRRLDPRRTRKIQRVRGREARREFRERGERAGGGWQEKDHAKARRRKDGEGGAAAS